jgi:hypothetical protein
MPCFFVSQEEHVPWLIVAERLRELPLDSLSSDAAAQLARGLRLLAKRLSTKDLEALRQALLPIDFADLDHISTDAGADVAQVTRRR